MAGEIIDLQQIRALKEAEIEWGSAPSLDDLPFTSRQPTVPLLAPC